MVLPPNQPGDLSDRVSERMRRDLTVLFVDQTVEEALDWLRHHPPPSRVIYFYVVDKGGCLRGVVPTRRLVLSAPEQRISDVMIERPVTLPATATVLDACEFFIQHRLLAFPVVDTDGQLVGVVDIDLYTEELSRLERSSVVGRLVEPFVRFMHVESSGGLVLLAATLTALVLANSSVADSYRAFWEIHAGITIGRFALDEPLRLWINEALMTLFFFVVGLEIKRELVAGELSDARKALLPIVAAVGGMIVPAAVYALALWGRPGRGGWGIPMATDIAFAVGFLALFGKRVPNGLKVLLLTLAIADDIGAVLVIAAVYSGPIALGLMACAAIGLGAVLLLRWIGVRSPLVYAVVGAGVWYAFLRSGVHPTLAGVALGLLTPARPLVGRGMLLDVVSDLYDRVRGLQRGTPQKVQELASPAERLEQALHPWVAFAIMPLFALANAGVAINPSALATPVAMAVAAGLVLGKPAGIVLFSYASVRLGLTRLPDKVDWGTMLGTGCLGGIGFTMSLFIAGLALDGTLLEEAKIGILGGSALSAILGCALLAAAGRRFRLTELPPSSERS
jgi:NhaA family Na+:H+ antiporter